MTETPNSNDQAERLRRLQERRAASGRPSPSASANVGTIPAAPQTRNARRRHPAAATRVLLAGLSVTSFFAVGGAIAVANRTTSVAQSAAVPAGNTTPGTTATTPATGGTAAQPAPAASAVVHTTTRAS
jgi:hypothetical protein